jgi:hypothetical protein
MAKNFGIKEAQAAGEFAKTREQKLTVLAVVRMLGMPILLTGEISKKITKLKRKTVKKYTKSNALSKKLASLETDIDIANVEINGLIDTETEWDV